MERGLTKCCRLTDASSGVLVSDAPPPAGLDVRREGGPDLEFWNMDRVASEMLERLSW